MEKIVTVYGSKPNRYRVADVRDWNFGFAVQQEVREDVYMDITFGMTKHDAIYMAMRLVEMTEKEGSK